MDRQNEVVMGFDLMYVNSLPFAVSISRELKLGIAEANKNLCAATLLTSIKEMEDIYSRRGFPVNTVLADIAFATLEMPPMSVGATLNIVALDDPCRR